MNVLVLFIAVLYIISTPFTKVEESFNVQAIHDILYHRFNLSEYDHNEFPGVVPRSFLAPIVISVVAAPGVALLEFFQVSKFWSQYLVRLVLCSFVVYSWTKLKTTLQQKLGASVGIWFTIITLSQFHFMFYMSRPLPNIMALPLVLMAINSWLRRETKSFLAFAGASIIIFRSELVILLGLFLMYDIFFQRVTIKDVVKKGVPIGIGLILLTIIIDSIFWGRLVWPELEVFWFNTILNKSSEWGTSPFFWYFYSALPRAMGLSLLFVPFGLILEPRIRVISIPAIMFVLIYSILPHKELRFIIYVFPLLNIAAACACHRAWINRNKSWFRTLLSWISIGHLLGNFLLTVFLLTVSRTNYPGGVAMSRLHRMAPSDQNITVHIDNLAAQSGVSRFTAIYSNWTYSKDEHLKAGDEELHKFDYLLTEVKNKYSPEMKLYQQTHENIELVECFSNIGLHYESLLPIKIRTKPCIMIMKKKRGSTLLKELVYEDTTEAIAEVENEEEIPEDSEEIQEEPEEEDVKPLVSEGEDEEQEEEQEKEVLVTPPKVKKIRKRKLIKPTENPRQKIREIIESEKSVNSNQESADDEDGNEDSVEKEVDKTKTLLEEISKLDLSKFCDLDKIDKKDCLKKIINEMESYDD